MKTLTDLRNELSAIQKDLNKLVRKCATSRKRAKFSLTEKEQILSEMNALSDAKQVKLLVICAINRPFLMN